MCLLLTMRMRTGFLILLVATMVVGYSHVAKADMVFFGEDINWTATGDNENAVRIPHPNSDAAQANFFAFLRGAGTETFEGFEANSIVNSIDFGPDTATLTRGLSALNQPSGTFNGVYPISGDQTLLQSISTSDILHLEFSSPQAAFGFYMTDVEIVGNLSLRFFLVDGVSTIDRVVPTQAGANGANNTGSVAYFGVIDTTNLFSGVSFVRTLNSNDGFGFDDMTIGRAAMVVPEPTYGVFWLTGLLAVMNQRRRSESLSSKIKSCL
ncbi:MAG: hypothetical protein R3C03_11510 [Pirellulaceae bacterium]